MKSISVASVFCLLGLTGCWFASSSQRQLRRDAQVAVSHYGCSSCHSIPGIAGANASVGPPLDRFGSRSYIAGTLQNTAENLAFWIQHPQQVHPGTAMPEMRVTPADAKTISLYLESLQ